MIAQALHIFRKDFFYLRMPLVVFLLLTVLFAFTQTSEQLSTISVVLLAASAGLTIARLVHAEAIVGTSQFWITRPYNWKSLLFAKLLFVLVCIDVPIGGARLAGLIRLGYPIVSSLPPLAWAQILLFCILAAMVALTSLTAGIVELILVLLGTALVVTVVLVGGRSFAMSRIPALAFWPNSVDWIPLSITGVLAAAIAAVTLRRQYRDRRTRYSRNLVVVGAVVTELAALAIPVSAGLRLQSLLSRGPAPDLRISLGRFAAPYGYTPNERVHHVIRLPIALEIEGVPMDRELLTDLADLRFAWPGGQIAGGNGGLFVASQRDGHATLHGRFEIPEEAFNRFQTTPATLHLSMYLTLFGDAESKTVPFDSARRNVGNGLQCFTDFRGQVIDNDFDVYNCTAFFGWPSRLVSVTAGRDREDFTRLVSYAPFSSGPALDSSQWKYVTIPWSAKEGPPKQVTVTMKRPLVHFHRDFEASNVRLVDLISNRP
ncbi:MAG: hypothetical protein KGN84_00850 [Acidobacteriota bacterium]|nr:hypothetical protein [Acidobacteriota bacterium]